VAVELEREDDELGLKTGVGSAMVKIAEEKKEKEKNLESWKKTVSV
jgi:hypothetical protein